MKFQIVKNFVDVTGLFDYFKSIEHLGDMNDEQSPGCPSFYKLGILGKLQWACIPKVEKYFGTKVFPTYNYSRIYNSKAILARHIDRPSCELSVTLNLGYEGDYSWPIWIEDNEGNKLEAILEEGDALLYHGCDCWHWRENADERVIKQAQAFLHYVDQSGPYSNFIFDSRPVC